MNEIQVDEAMLPFNEFVEELSDHVGQIGDADDIGIVMEIERIKAELPMEMDILVDENGKVKLGASGPLFQVETTDFPVFHKISFVLVESNG